VEQVLPEHDSPARQACPQEPQFRGSVAVVAQTPVQEVVPVGHAQVPALQTCSAEHT
jgi:hypothetical protein